MGMRVASDGASLNVTVVGAGIVGMCCALRLQQDGHRVTVIDPRQPGTVTSFGNAGIIGTSAIMPYSAPGLWKKLPKMLLDPMSPLRLPWRHAPKAAPWLLRFLAAGNKAKVAQTAGEMAPLVRATERAHRDLITTNGIEQTLMRPVGFLEVYRDAKMLDATAYEQSLLSQHGFRFEVLSADEIRQLEPGLSGDFTKALFLPDESFVVHPVALTRAYTEAFLGRGGDMRHEKVQRFELGSDGPRQVVTDLGMHAVDRVVIAAGAWSRELARMLGSEVPLEAERGYHLNLPWNDKITLNRPVFVAEKYYLVVPMRDGVRVTSGSEFGGVELPPDFRRIYRILRDARRALPSLNGEVNREWMGYRPAIPDSKPVIGRSPKHKRVFFAFGHGHLGLTLSAVTSELVSCMVAERDSPIALEPFRVDRF